MLHMLPPYCCAVGRCLHCQVYELLQLLGMKNVRLEDVRQMIAETDKDGSGSVDFEEFLQAGTHSRASRAGSRGGQTLIPKLNDRALQVQQYSCSCSAGICCQQQYSRSCSEGICCQVDSCLGHLMGSCRCDNWQLCGLQVASKKQQLPYSKADVLRSFRMFADRGAPPGCIVPETLEAALVGDG
jgi:hypothetical protein